MELKHKRVMSLAVALMVSASCVGCVANAKVQPGRAGDLLLVDAKSLPAPSAGDYTAASDPFTLGPFDLVDIEVFGNPEMRAERIQVDASGRITFLFAGTLEVAGRTPGEVGNLIADKLRGRYLRDPVVSVNLKETASQVVTISGEIKRPGIYPVIRGMSLLKAIARAEGWTEFSKRREVLVLREVGGQKYAALYDVGAIEKGNYSDPILFANDTIIVGFSAARRNFKDLMTAAPPLIAPLIFLLGNN